jgi:hypothetical protein
MGLHPQRVGLVGIWLYLSSIYAFLASASVSVNDMLPLPIESQHSIQQWYPLVPYLYVIAKDALEYLLEATQMQGQIKVSTCPTIINFLMFTL